MDQISVSRYDLNRGKRNWSNAEKEDIMDMYNERYSTGVIAQKYNCTRNMIVGIINRLRKTGTVLNGKVVRPSEGPIMPGKKRCKPTVALNPHYQAKLLPPPPKPKRVRLRIVAKELITLAELEPWSCRYPFGDPRQSDFRFCGARKEHVGPYCKKHKDLCSKESFYKR